MRQIPWRREGVWIILTKYQTRKFWNHFILEKYLTHTHTSDPCFTTPLKQLDFFASLLVLFVQSLFSLSEDLLQKKITVLVTIDTAPDKLEGNLYTPAVNFVLTTCQTEECCKSLHTLDVCTLAYSSISSNSSVQCIYDFQQKSN